MGLHGWAFAGSFQWFMVILYDDMPVMRVGVELLQTKAH